LPEEYHGTMFAKECSDEEGNRFADEKGVEDQKQHPL
jgi:hypothetical protein